MIVVAGLTPAVSQIMQFDSFREGEVNRARNVRWCASGKVINVGIALTFLGGKAITIAPIGGGSGEFVRNELTRIGVPSKLIKTRSQTRICTTILSGDGMVTELVEEAAPLGESDLSRFKDHWKRAVAIAHVVVISGSIPRGTNSNFFSELIHGLKCNVVLDVRGPELISSLAARPFVVKPNREELAHTVGRSLRDNREVYAAMRELNNKGAEWVVVSQGPKPVLVSSSEKQYRLSVLRRCAINPIGAGDYLTAGIAWSLSKGQDLLDAVRFGVAAATARVEHILPPTLNAAALLSLSQRVVVQEVKQR